MSPNHLRGIPPKAAQRAVFKRGAKGHYAVITGDDEIIVSLTAKIALYKAARATLRRGKGRQTDFRSLLLAAKVLQERGLSITTGENSIAPRVVAQALYPKTWKTQIGTARQVCRRLKELVGRI